VRLALLNSLGRGELFDINWRRLQEETQDLKAKANFPFLFNTPFGIDYQIKLYKKDTTYIETNQNIGIQYSLTGTDYFKVYANPKTSSLLSTKGLESLTVLPPYADISATIYGIGYRTERLDYRFNPRKGYSLTVSAGAGNRRIKKNSKLNPSLYDSLKVVSAQYNSDFEGAVYLPLIQRSAIKIGLQSAWQYNSTKIFVNELFRFGGLKTLRGFDEESILASSYVIGTLEYRFIFEENSFINLFFDQGYYENKVPEKSIYAHPFGFGAGISFQTKAGIFSLNYALGSQFGNPIFLRSGKIHFGIVNYF
jgi:hemolysin activation/secretion protein